MAQQISAPRGMRDILPSEKRLRERTLSVIRGVYRAHGFEEIEAPALEQFERLHTGLGGENEKLSYSLLKRGLSGEQIVAAASAGSPAEQLCDLGLRFDLTVPLARYYASNRAHLPRVFRAMHTGSVWRAERPQKNRYRQFTQCDIDIIGEPRPLAELELISATSHALHALGLRDCVIRLNDRRILNAFLLWAGFLPEQTEHVLICIDKLDKVGAEKVGEMLAEINAPAADRICSILKAVPATGVACTRETVAALLPAELDHAPTEELISLAAALSPALPQGVTLRFDISLVRGMGYYTGTIFEIAHPASGSSIGGGGRYDRMLGRFLNEDVPAVGFSLGFERIIDLVQLSDDHQERVLAILLEKNESLSSVAKHKTEQLANFDRVILAHRQKNMKTLFEQLREQKVTHLGKLRDDCCEITDFSSHETAKLER